VTPPSSTAITASFSAWSCTLPEYRTRFMVLPFVEGNCYQAQASAARASDAARGSSSKRMRFIT
jgi:hypothetical protein